MTAKEDSEQRFFEGDVITVRGNEYTVESVDQIPGGEVLQYRLEARREDLAGTLKVHDEGYVIAEYYDVDGDDITVIA